MIDTHAHINTEAFDKDRDEVIKNAKEAGVKNIVIPAIEPNDFDDLIRLTQSDEMLRCCIGIHPHNAMEASDVNLQRVEQMSKEEGVVAIGEIGLDYYYDFTPKEVQKVAFRRQLRIAKRQGLPVVIHNRESDDDMMQILKEEQDGTLRGVLHCFSSPVDFLNKAVNLGFYISFTGNITFKNTDLDQQVKDTPLNKIMLETDSPYMTPVPNRGKRNEPKYVRDVAEKISEIKSITLDEVISMTTENARKFFNLSLLLVMLAIAPFSALAQTDEEYYDEEDEYYYEDMEEPLPNPYKKFIGFGPVLGFNTIVETQQLPGGQDRDVSYEGIIAYGGMVAYSPLKFLVLDLSYTYSKNTKIAEDWDYLVEPSIYQSVELSSHWIANPYGRVNIFGSIGASLLFNSIGTGEIENPVEDVTETAINTGIGIYINIDTPYGLFTPSFEWKLNFSLEDSQGYAIEADQQNPGEVKITPVDVSKFFSVPRFYLVWYPKI